MTCALAHRGLWPALVAIGLGLSGCGGDGTESTPASSRTFDAPAELEPLPELDQVVIAELRVKLQIAFSTLRGGDAQSAVDYFNACLRMVPEATVLHYYLGVGRASLGNHLGALNALDAAAARGFCDPAKIENDPTLDAVCRQPGWQAIREEMMAARAAFRTPDARSYRNYDPDQEPAFTVLDSLRAHYTRAMDRPSAMMMLYSDCRILPHVWEVLNHKLAGLEKFRRTADQDQLLDVDIEILRTISAYEDPGQAPWLPSTVELIRRKAAWFIQQHRNEAEPCAQAAYLTARAALLSGIGVPLAAAIDTLTAIDTRYPGTTGALFAMAEALERIAEEHGMDATVLAPVVRRLSDGYANHPGMRQLGYKLRQYILAVDGLPPIRLTDLDGNVWDTSAMQGTVFLLDFWATWCGPCRREIPTLVEMYAEYRDRGFQIIGISLDKPSNTTPESLRSWAQNENMTWPLVFDGKYWSTIGVKECGISAIPFPILVDRGGQVVAAGEGATAQNLRDALKRLFPED